MFKRKGFAGGFINCFIDFCVRAISDLLTDIVDFVWRFTKHVSARLLSAEYLVRPNGECCVARRFLLHLPAESSSKFFSFAKFGGKASNNGALAQEKRPQRVYILPYVQIELS